MRSAERYLNSLGLAYYASSLIMNFSFNPTHLIVSQILLVLISFWYEGLRVH